MTVTVAIPGYNAAKTLAKCIDSVLKQKNVDVEILIIIDKSDDATCEISKKYADTNKNVAIINKCPTEKGLGKSRNIAFDRVQTEYLYFLDADDYLVDSECISSLVSQAAKFNLDIVVGSYQVEDEKKGFIRNVINPDVNLKYHQLRKYLYDSYPSYQYPTYAWGKLYNVSYIQRTGMRCVFNVAEDLHLAFLEMHTPAYIGLSSKVCISYIQHQSSITATQLLGDMSAEVYSAILYNRDSFASLNNKDQHISDFFLLIEYKFRFIWLVRNAYKSSHIPDTSSTIENAFSPLKLSKVFWKNRKIYPLFIFYLTTQLIPKKMRRIFVNLYHMYKK